MPQTYPLLRSRFLKRRLRWWWPFGERSYYYEDGVVKCQTLLIEAGYSIHAPSTGIITSPREEDLTLHTRGEIMDALDYLCEEWDYAVREKL